MPKMSSPTQANAQSIQPKPDPVMTNVQEDTNVEDLGSTNNLEGSGFKVNGGSMGSKNKNAKLRKFISLNIK
ncbi:MAG: hypothetical protein ACK50E_01545 [Bacteroidota bacterium]